MASLPESVRAIVDGNNFATIGTVNADGSPQTSVVWITRDGDDLLVSTLRGRLKERHLSRDRRASGTAAAPDAPYSYFEARGPVTMTEEGGDKLINDLALKYTGE